MLVYSNHVFYGLVAFFFCFAANVNQEAKKKEDGQGRGFHTIYPSRGGGIYRVFATKTWSIEFAHRGIWYSISKKQEIPKNKKA